jgi:xylulokinase
MSAADPLLLGVDLGTTAIKCAAYRPNGTPVASASREYRLLTPEPAAVEVPVATYWEAFSAAIRDVLRSPDVSAGAIHSLGISAQGETLVPVTGDGTPVRDAIVWLDSRPAEEADVLASHFEPGEFYEITGQPEMLPTWPAAKILWLSRHEPGAFAQTRRFALLEDYFVWRLTGEWVCEGSLVTSTGYWDFRKKSWSKEMLALIGVGVDQLPDLVEPGTAVGQVRPPVAVEIGLSTSTMVCTGALDQACGAIGAGNITPGQFSENTGAAIALCATLDGPRLDPEGRMPCHYHGLADRYMFHTFTSGGIVLRWFRDQFGDAEKSVAAAAGQDPYDLLIAEAERIAPGAEGLLAVPHLQGAMAPESNPAARGALIGLSLRHGRGHVARAILESVAFVVRRNVEVLESLGIQIPEILAIGGGARSGLWKQIEADVTGRPVRTTREPDAAALGAAILGGSGSGRFGDVSDLVSAMVRPAGYFEPDPGRARFYDELYQAYCAAYTALCPTFATLMSKAESPA